MLVFAVFKDLIDLTIIFHEARHSEMDRLRFALREPSVLERQRADQAFLVESSLRPQAMTAPGNSRV